MKKALFILIVISLSVLICFGVGCNQLDDEKDIIGIYVSKSPDKVNYFAGESLDIEGCEITVRRKNRDDYTVKVTPQMVSGFSSALGNHTLTITYVVGETSFITTQTISVLTRVANSAVISEQPKNTTFIEGQKIDLSGLIAEVTFSDKTVADRHFGAFTMSKTIAELGMEEVELRLDKATIKVAITVVPKVIIELQATALPLKTTYEEGELFESAGLEVYAMYNDGSKGYLVDYEVVNENIPLIATQNSVMIVDKYARNLTLEIPITVNVLEISKIEILNKEALRKLYLVSSLLDFSNMTAKITFEDGAEKVVDQNSLVFDLPLDKPLETGEYTIKVKYKYASASEVFDAIEIIVVAEKRPTSFRIETTKSFNSLYEDGEPISLLGLSVYIQYNDGSEDWVIYGNQINEEISGFSMTEFANASDPCIEFYFGEIKGKIDIYVTYDESEFEAEPKE